MKVKIHSDQWCSYSKIEEKLGFEHKTVNHSDIQYKFVARDGTHTQAIESYWNKRKMKNKLMRGCRENHLKLYLAEWMWRDRNLKEVKEKILKLIGEFANK